MIDHFPCAGCGHDAADHEDRLTDAADAPCRRCACQDFYAEDDA